MKRKGLEQITVVSLFILVLIVFSFAERDTRKLERLYKTAGLLHKKQPSSTVHVQPAPAQPVNN